MRRVALVLPLLLLFPPSAPSAEPIMVDGVRLGAAKAEVLKLPTAAEKGGVVTVSPDDGTSIEVSFDKGKVKRVYASHRKGLAPMKELTTKYGEPVKQDKGDSIKYVYKVAGEGSVTLEKVKGYPGFYLEAVR
jgi:hypothetical protein